MGLSVPSSDPTKTQPGETGPFDPNAEPPAPAPAPDGSRTSAAKPFKDTKELARTRRRYYFTSLKVLSEAMLTQCHMQGVTPQVTEVEPCEYLMLRVLDAQTSLW